MCQHGVNWRAQMCSNQSDCYRKWKISYCSLNRRKWCNFLKRKNIWITLQLIKRMNYNLNFGMILYKSCSWMFLKITLPYNQVNWFQKCFFWGWNFRDHLRHLYFICSCFMCLFIWLGNNFFLSKQKVSFCFVTILNKFGMVHVIK